MTHPDSATTRLAESIATGLPWAQGPQLKGLTTFVGALIEPQTGTQAEVARRLGNQAAGVKRLARLLPHDRLAPQRLADAVLEQAGRQGPSTGKVRRALEWTMEGDQPRLGVSWGLGGRAVPRSWRAYPAMVWQGRRRRAARAVSRRAVRRVQRALGQRRLRVPADRGFAEVALVDVLTELGGSSGCGSRAVPRSVPRANGAPSPPCFQG